ncbi:MAG TPA: DUF4432 family protein, partial [Armatimonadetes bacterium]|nr:DUF4432 family protein [Armatimonadota bacterium]
PISFYEPEAFNWLRGFHGGLMTTCGLVHAGWPAEDEGRTYGLHGRASYTPASNVVTDGYWDGDEYVIFAQGKVREAIVFGEHLELIRRIWTRLGERRLFVHDRIVNKGFERTPLMLLYHCNIGFPIVDEGAELIAPSIEVTPRDDIAASGLEEHNQVSAPQPNYKEQVFFHKLGATQDGNTVVAMVNPHLMDGQGLGVYIRFNTAELPQMVQWKMMGESTYVVGLEPTNLTIVDRIEAKEQGVLPYLESGEEREFHLEIGVVHGADEINALRTEVANLKG